MAKKFGNTVVLGLEASLSGTDFAEVSLEYITECVASLLKGRDELAQFYCPFGFSSPKLGIFLEGEGFADGPGGPYQSRLRIFWCPEKTLIDPHSCCFSGALSPFLPVTAMAVGGPPLICQWEWSGYRTAPFYLGEV